jgi:hypothetical protein
MDAFNNCLTQARIADRVLFSVMGPHAKEGVNEIFSRKIKDIEVVGHTCWLHRSCKAKPDQVQRFCGGIPLFVIFLNPSSKEGARLTTEAQKATHFSVDSRNWSVMPPGLGPVTGKMGIAFGLTFDVLATAPTSPTAYIDLWEYHHCESADAPIRFNLGASTLCAERGDTSSSPLKLVSHLREVVAVGRLCLPFSVWLRANREGETTGRATPPPADGMAGTT